MSSQHRTGPRPSRGFTLIELMVAVVIAGILAAVALPAYTGFITKSRAQDASADLASLALNLENRFQLQLRYPDIAADTVATSAAFPGWAPTQAKHFAYTLTSDATSYTLTATGKDTLSSCTLSLAQDNARSASSACGFTSW